MPPYRLKSWIPLDKLKWSDLSANPGAIELLRANQDKINWHELSQNPGIFPDPSRAATPIQQGFRKSRGYAAWKYSPERLASQGYFENNLNFGKKRKVTNSGMSLKTINKWMKYLNTF